VWNLVGAGTIGGGAMPIDLGSSLVAGRSRSSSGSKTAWPENKSMASAARTSGDKEVLHTDPHGGLLGARYVGKEEARRR